jgi:glutathione synthase/RimK-type ligase-like ATP-grasp enzyme
MQRPDGPTVTAARVALATAAEAVGLDDDEPLLLAALRSRGIAAESVVWDDPAADWAAWDLAVLRSTWDYPRRREAFLSWARQVATTSALHNPPGVVAWSSDKRYLLELAAAGVPTVPSAIAAPGEPVQLPADGPFVVKPSVSAGSQDTARYEPAQRAAATAHAERLHAQGRDVLVQPYLADVDVRGETAIVHIGGRYSHAIRKGPILAGDVETVGGLFAREQIDVRVPTAEERAVAEAAFAALPFPADDLLYGRVDLVPAPDGPPLVLEVELVEPSLFLRFDAGAGDRLADAIAARLGASVG